MKAKAVEEKARPARWRRFASVCDYKAKARQPWPASRPCNGNAARWNGKPVRAGQARMPYNLDMNHFDILLAFALPPSELASDLQRAVRAPALSMLTARAKSQVATDHDEYARALPHETWLASQLGLASMSANGLSSSPPLAQAVRAACALEKEDGTWFVLTPVQLHVARDHLVLADRRQLELSEPESRALFETARPLFEEFGHALRYASASTWLLRADAWADLSTSTPDAASGHNIDIWLPKGAGERDWRRLQNEVQMAWHDHPVNQQREARGVKPVNSLWLWAATPAALPPAAAAPAQPMRYPGIATLPGWSEALAEIALVRQLASAPAWSTSMAPAASQALHYDSSLIGPALVADWSSWLAQLQRLESEVFLPALEALKSGRLASLALVFTHGTRTLEFIVSKNSLARFWIKPTLGKLFK
ncbi:MAG: hypothetical protein ACRYGK_16385 [Janthinobacterium lividum]